jgi:hypothetical protein
MKRDARGRFVAANAAADIIEGVNWFWTFLKWLPYLIFAYFLYRLLGVPERIEGLFSQACSGYCKCPEAPKSKY